MNNWLIESLEYQLKLAREWVLRLEIWLDAARKSK